MSDRAFALDLSRLALRLTGGLAHELAVVATLRALLPRWVADDDVDAVLDEARSIEAEGRITADEQAAFEAWFGAAAAAQVLLPEDLDLVDFIARHPPARHRRLFDLLLESFSDDQHISPEERSRLARVARAMDIDDTMLTALLHEQGDSARRVEIRLGGAVLRIGRAATCDLALPDLQVAPHHADLVAHAGGWRIQAMGSRLLVVDDQTVHAAPLLAGQPVRIGPYVVQHDGERLWATTGRRLADLAVRDLTRRAGAKVILQPLSFVAFTGEVIAVIGPSGSGKSTLVSALCGAARPDGGQVRFDGRPLDDLLSDNPGAVGFVPQDDVVAGELTVRESLACSARLRLPPDASEDEVTAAVTRVLDELELTRAADTPIGTRLRRGVSGGQRKRVNFGQALVGRDTRLVVLDEPTSGLDPRAAQGIAHLARQLADRDRLVLLVTHDLTPRVVSQVDHLLVLSEGGRLVFFGPVEAALQWFEVDTPDAIFDALGRRPPEALEARWSQSAVARQWVHARLDLVDRMHRGDPERHARPPRPAARFARNLTTLVSRYVRIRARDPMGLVVLLSQPVLLAAVMVAVFSAVTVELLLMVTLSALWFGMSAGVRELLVDRAIWREERRVGVTAGAYLASKVLVLAPVVALQGALMVLLVAAGMRGHEHTFDDMGFHVLWVTGVCALTGFAGLSIGLLASALTNSPAAAVGALVLILVPQLALSGVPVPLHHMGPVAQVAAQVTHERYALEAALLAGDEVAYLGLTRTWQQIPVQGARVKAGYTESGDDPGWTEQQLNLLLLLAAALKLGLTWAVLAVRARR